MIVPGQKVKVKWSNRNVKYYTDLGYIRYNNGEFFEVELKELPKASHSLVKLNCDFCGIIFTKKYRNTINNKNHFCKKECHSSFMVGKPSWNSNKIIVNCSNCKAEIERSSWELKRSKNLYCNKTCFNEHNLFSGAPKVKRFITNCDECGIQIERTEKEMQRSLNRFCSKPCSDKFSIGRINEKKRNGKDIPCHYCKSKFYLAKNRIESQQYHFCNNNCRIKWMKTEEFSRLMQRESTLIDICCTVCDISLKRKPAEVKVNKTGKFYCSLNCKNKDIKNWGLPQSQKGLKVPVSCYSCGKNKLVHPSVHSKNKYFFCSFYCYQDKRLEITEGKLTATSIHLKVNSLLESMGIQHINEKRFSSYLVDIYIPSKHYAIEVNGDYWHSSPLLYKDKSKLNSVQKKGIKKDNMKNKVLVKRHQLKVLYLWEKDINQNIEKCEKLIEYFLKSEGDIENYNSFNYSLINNKLITSEEIINPYSMD